MIHSVCGLNADQVGLVVHALSHSDDKDLATLFITSLALIDTTLLLLLKEMFSTRKHILYWTQLAKSPSWEIYLYRLNSVVFKSVFVDKERDYLILNSSELMLRHAEMLRSDLSDLSILLEKVSVAASHLKAVYVQLNSVGGTMSDARRKLGLIKPGLQSESDFKVPDGDSFDDIGVKLGLSMVSVEDEGLSLGHSQPQPRHMPAHPARSVFGLSVPSEDDEWEIKESAAEVLEQQQRVRFERRGDSGSGGGAEEELGLIRLGVRRELEQCLVGLAEAFAEYLPHLVLALPMLPAAHTRVEKPQQQQQGQEEAATVAGAAGAPSPGLKLNPSGKRADLSLQELEDLYDRLETFLDTLRVTRGPKAFPLQFTQARVHKPSDRERYWFRNLVMGLAGLYTLKTGVSLWRDGSVLAGYHFLEGKVQDHIVEPMTKLAGELFDTIRKRDEVVTREECEESRESLHRMLRDFSQTDHGSSLIADMKDRIKDTIKEQKQAAVNVASKITGHVSGGGNGGGSGGIVGGDSVASSGSGGSGGGGGVGADLGSSAVQSVNPAEFTPEQALSALMSAYEKELQAPVKGIMFGNLATAILIQMQKLKVHTEAAMLKMDQILASNELTIAATAAMPAFGFIGLMLLQLRKWLQPRASSPGLATMHLRLIMSDVERSLQEVQELSSAPHSGSSGGESGKFSATSSLYYAAGGGSRAASAVFDASHHTHKQPLQPLSPGARDDGREKESKALDGKLQRYQASLQTRRVQIARGTLQFNLVRLRSEFQSLFGGSKGTVASVSSDSVSQARGLSLTRGANRGLGLGGGATLGMSMGMGMGFSSPRPSFSVASTMRQYRLRRSSSAATASTLYASSLASDPVQAAASQSAASAADGNSGTQGQPKGDCANEQAKMELVSQMLAFMQNDESHDTSITLLGTVQGVLSRLLAMVFGAGEELTATTQYGSLSRDIALLESPDFEVSLDRKICTAARMRATYSCLMPAHK